MKAAAIKEKINKVLEVVKESFTAIKKSLSLSWAKTLSLFKNQESSGKAGKSSRRAAVKKTEVKTPSVFAAFGAAFSAKIDFLANRFLGRFPEKKRRPIIYVFGSLCVLFLVLVISAIVSHSGKPKTSVAPDVLAGIPHEELFYPAEPNYVPRFLLEREPRHFWIVDDISLYWKKPAPSDFWQKEIKAAVDKLMDGVP